MTEYIERDSFLSCKRNQYCMNCDRRKRGEWKRMPDPYGWFETIPVCSICGCTTKWRETYMFCPNCGADMRQEDGE